jgi:hypothetical protein
VHREVVLRVAAARFGIGPLQGWEKLALTAWLGTLLVVGVRAYVAPRSHTVYSIYSDTAQLWWQGLPLYEPDRPASAETGYRYSPTFAVLMTPFGLLPLAVGAVLWRWSLAGLLLGALAWWARAVLPRAPTRVEFAQLALLALSLALASLSNGQANVLVLALLLVATAATAEGRWNLASACLAVAFVAKVYPLALGLLLVLLYPRQLGWRLALATAASLVLPFFFQWPEYVARQYADWISLLSADDRSTHELTHMYRDLWLLCRLWGIPMARVWYMAIQLGVAAGIAALCWRRRQVGWPQRALLTSGLALAVSWMLLLGPATEACTIILLGPSLAWALLEWRHAGRPRWQQGLVLGAGTLLGASAVAGLFPWAIHLHALGPHPLAELLFLAYLAVERRPPPHAEGDSRPLAAQAA